MYVGGVKITKALIPRATRIVLGLICLMSTVVCASAQTPSFNFVGYPAGADGSSAIYGLSADGTVAAGFGGGVSRSPGFTWTAATGRNDFGLLPGMPNSTLTFGIAADASTVVGRTGTGIAFRYPLGGTLQTLGTVNGWRFSQANAASGDGSVVVGTLTNTLGTAEQVFRWTAATGMVRLVAPGSFVDVGGVSRDGTKMVGARAGATRTDAYVWTAATGFQTLPALPGNSSGAAGMNFDGSIIVGASGNGVPAMWRNGQPTALGVPVGFSIGSAMSVSLDGSIAAGFVSRGGNDSVGFVWTPSGGPQLLETYLLQHGLSIPSGWQSVQVSAVSDDGLTIAGWAIDSSLDRQGFVATIPAPAAIFVGPFVLLLAGRRKRLGSF